MFIKKLYYSVWSDGIKRLLERFPKSISFVKFMMMFWMVVSFGGFSMFFYAFIGNIIHLPWPSLNLQNDFWNNLLSPLVFFMLPWFLLHYYLVFWKNKYQTFLPEYKYRNGKLFLSFFMCLIFIPIAFFLISLIIAKVIAT